MTIPFSGNRKAYRRVATLTTVALHVWIYVVFVAVKFIAQDENWLAVWQLPAALVVSAVVVGALHFRWMMRLDAQYGKGSAWEMRELTVKLPSLKSQD